MELHAALNMARFAWRTAQWSNSHHSRTKRKRVFVSRLRFPFRLAILRRNVRANAPNAATSPASCAVSSSRYSSSMGAPPGPPPVVVSPLSPMMSARYLVFEMRTNGRNRVHPAEGRLSRFGWTVWGVSVLESANTVSKRVSDRNVAFHPSMSDGAVTNCDCEVHRWYVNGGSCTRCARGGGVGAYHTKLEEKERHQNRLSGELSALPSCRRKIYRSSGGSS